MARNIERKEFPVLEMSCASCANHVEQTVRHLEGVGEASVNFASNTLSVAFDPGTSSRPFRSAMPFGRPATT